MARADAEPDQRPCPLLRGTCQDSQELPPIKDGHAAVSADRQEGRVSGNEVVDATRRRAAQKVVVVWITAHPRARLVGEKHGLGAKQLQERLSCRPARSGTSSRSWVGSGPRPPL